MSRTKTPHIDVDSILNLIGDFAGDTREFTYCRYTFSLRFPLSPVNGHYRAHIRVEVMRYERDECDEPWVMIPDARVVRILRRAQRDNEASLVTKRKIQLTWGVLRNNYWVTIRAQISHAYNSMDILDGVLREISRVHPQICEPVQTIQIARDGETTNEFFGLLDDERRDLQKIIANVKGRYLGAVKNYELQCYRFLKNFI